LLSFHLLRMRWLLADKPRLVVCRLGSQPKKPFIANLRPFQTLLATEPSSSRNHGTGLDKTLIISFIYGACVGIT
jgi:hypothetical protein